MAISNRTPADNKSVVIETLVAWERAVRGIKQLSAQLAPFTDAQVSTQLGTVDADSNLIKATTADAMTVINTYSSTNLTTLLGLHPV